MSPEVRDLMWVASLAAAARTNSSLVGAGRDRPIDAAASQSPPRRAANREDVHTVAVNRGQPAEWLRKTQRGPFENGPSYLPSVTVAAFGGPIMRCAHGLPGYMIHGPPSDSGCTGNPVVSGVANGI